MTKTSKVSRCKDCGERIRWAITPARKKIAISDGSDPKGNYLLQSQRNYGTGEMELHAIPLTASQKEVQQQKRSLLFLAHAAVCLRVDRPRHLPDPARIQELRQQIEEKLNATAPGNPGKDSSANGTTGEKRRWSS